MPTPSGAPSVVDILARQVLGLVDQLHALETTMRGTLETIRVLQDAEAQRFSAATARAGAEDEGPHKPPTFGHPRVADRASAEPSAAAPPLPPLPPDLAVRIGAQEDHSTTMRNPS